MQRISPTHFNGYDLVWRLLKEGGTTRRRKLHYEYACTSATFMDADGVALVVMVCSPNACCAATWSSRMISYGSPVMVTPLDALTCHTCLPSKKAVIDWPGMNRNP